MFQPYRESFRLLGVVLLHGYQTRLHEQGGSFVHPLVSMCIRNYGSVAMELFPEYAPHSVASFIYMIKQGVYNNQPIQRIIPDFVIQPSYQDFDNALARTSLRGEFCANGVANDFPLKQGSLALAGDGKRVSSASCFFWVLSDEAGLRLQGKYAGFGQVKAGWNWLEAIQRVSTRSVRIDVPGVVINEPLIPVLIERVSVNTFGVDYHKPELLNYTSYG